MAIDRSKYKKANAEEMQKVSNEIESRESSTRAAFLKVEPGINIFRIFPAPIKAKSSLFMFPKTTAFLPFEEDEKDDKGNKTGKVVVKRRAIFNAKVHGDLDRDIVEEYIEAVKQKLSAKYSDKKQLFNALNPLVNWKTGIKPTSSWCCYARKKKGDDYTYGRLQLTNGAKKQLDSLCLRQSETGEAMVVDLLSDPDKGVSIQWVNNPQAEDAKAKNKLTLLFEQDTPLSDEELEWLENQDSLESLFVKSFTRKDFERELKGLQKFDSDSGFDVFETPSFQSIIESCRKEVEEKIPEADSKTSSSEEKKEVEMPEILQEMDKKTLKELIELLSLNIEVKVTTPPTKLKKAILNAIVETYEVTEAEDIKNIIEGAFEESEEDSSEEEPSEESGKEEEESEEQEDVEEQEEKKFSVKPKASKLLEKYRNRNK